MTGAPPPQVNRIGSLDLPATRLQFTTRCLGLTADQWSTTSPAVNLSLVARPAMLALQEGGVPLPGLKLAENTGHMHAIFRPVVWRIDASRRLYDPAHFATRGAAWMRKAAAYFYHEARHTEQFFLIARYLASKPTALTVNEVAIQSRIPQSTRIAVGVAPPQPAPAAGAEITRWIDGYVGSEQVQDGIDAASKQVELTGEMIANEDSFLPGDFNSDEECRHYLAWIDELRTLATRAEEAYRDQVARYVAMPMEEDAYAVAAGVGGAAAPDPAARARAWRGEKIDGQFAAYMRKVNEKVAEFRTRPAPQPPAPAPDAPAPQPDAPAQAQELVLTVQVEQHDGGDLILIE